MIFVERAAKPSWFNSPKVQEVFQKQKDFMLHEQNQYEIRSGRFDKDQFTLPMDSEMEEIIVKVFQNKCPFCESLVMGSDSNYSTDEIKRCQKELKTLITSKAKGKQASMDVKRGFRRFYGEETVEGFEAYDIGFFRPELRAMNANGTVSPAHYWWLGWDWNNLFLICSSCLVAKENKFPIAAANRASFSEQQDMSNLRKGLEEEEALLIDPCQKGLFEKRHILFKRGKALGVDAIGQQTISVFKLNRPNLEANRLLVSEAKAKEIEMIFQGQKPMQKILSPSHPFVAACLDEWWLNSSQDTAALEHCQKIFDGDLPLYFEQEAAPTTSYTVDKVSDMERKQKADEKRANSYDLENKENLDAYFTRSLWITEVVLTNFKAFEQITIDFRYVNPESGKLKTNTRRPWLALLGENGVGKSSISQAIALTLMGKRKLESMDIVLNDFIRFDQPKARVEVLLEPNEPPIVLEIIRNEQGGTFTLSEETPQVLVMAYGATRLPSKDALYGKDKNSFIRTSNLFDPNAKLGNGFKWLADEEQVPEPIFLPLSEGLSNLLQLESGQKIKRDLEKKELYLEEELEDQVAKKKTPFKYLSSGYQTLLAIALDIMMGAAELLRHLPTQSNDASYSLLDVAGIVMIDEIGVHLHPRWKMRIVKTLKRTFPKMSFIITTHDPLCLRGLVQGEVAILQRDPEQNNQPDIVDPEHLPSVQHLSIQELLTSTFFGLNSIMDPEVEKYYDEYYSLLATTDPNKKDTDRLEEIKEILKQSNLTLGNKVTEEIEYKLIEKKVEMAKSKKDLFKEADEEDVKNILDKWEKALSTDTTATDQ